MAQPVPKIGLISLGCPKALVDSEQIITHLRAQGYQLQGNYHGVDLVIVNTCGFIDDAIAESLDAIGEALRENGKVIVTGCLGKQAKRIKQRYPQVLAVTGAHAHTEVIEAVHQYLPPPQQEAHTSLIPPGGIKLTPRHYAYVKISEGCNHHCTFCIIPDLRGKLQSRPIGEVLLEAQNLINAGVRELLIIAQDTSAYGLDQRYQTGFFGGKPLKTRFFELARELGQMDAWVRLHYVYPYPHVDEVIPLMAEGLILPYLDVPLQHSNAQILQAMRRPANQENLLRRIARWRDICPDITLRSTFIVGFPGETEAQFQELLNFLREVRLDRVGAFAYSPVEGATANQLPGAISDEEKQDRLARFMACQQEISREKLARKVGQSMRVIVDSEDEQGVIARSKADAPEIDGLVFVENIQGAQPGDFLSVRVIDHSDHDLWAEVI